LEAHVEKVVVLCLLFAIIIAFAELSPAAQPQPPQPPQP
jgi:hypothetical protein